MKHKHRIFKKGEYCHTLLYSRSDPSVLLPVKFFIKDVKWDSINPQYKGRICYFYDSMRILKKYFFGMTFKRDFGERYYPMLLKATDFNTTRELEARLSMQDQDKFEIVVDSIMSVKTKAELSILFDKVQYALICKNLKDTKELMTRPFYKGIFKIHDAIEYRNRMYKAIGDLVQDADVDWTKFSKTI